MDRSFRTVTAGWEEEIGEQGSILSCMTFPLSLRRRLLHPLGTLVGIVFPALWSRFYPHYDRQLHTGEAAREAVSPCQAQSLLTLDVG